MERPAVPRLLVAVSTAAPPGASDALVPALQALGLEVHSVDLGEPPDGIGWVRKLARVGRVLSHLTADKPAVDPLTRELATWPPDATLGLDVGTVAALADARRQGKTRAPVIACAGVLAPGAAWGDAAADRYTVLDDEARALLVAEGVPEAEIVVAGPLVQPAFAAAAREERAAVRTRLKLSGPCVLLDVQGLGKDGVSAALLQLGLGSPRTLLIDVGGDVALAEHVRGQAAALAVRAKMFARIPDAPGFWRAADVVIGRPTPRLVARAIACQATLLALPGGATDEREAAAVESRGLGRAAATLAVLGATLESALRPEALEAAQTAARLRQGDAATRIAALAQAVIADRERILAEPRDRIAPSAAAAPAPPGAGTALDPRPLADHPRVEQDLRRLEVEDELAALKRKMEAEKRGSGR